ncbi:3-methyl-2-oxobutanoate hydroxymethyltransferase [Tepidibacillus fermentans]|uniref:3-methyl-2-oxobutanoate hydroxymethyltransferase n=1 Tax=Tepidibacillus fermentans TaxID=1281767 RepID=A0A4R3KK36_9BACI|nr:3-methyl-2-oxobutanoate hydroxymethyltransferase [Tepidibacillus fermentans]TCS84161.1 ketopantoate hydroxymethyltransferase [Tepidibacillus fermentans]
MEQKAITTHDLKQLKAKKEPITMVTAYDYPTAKLIDESGIEMILVGDSLGMVVLGYDTTIPVTLEDMIHHGKAVVRGAKRAFVVVDMPFLTYHLGIKKAVYHAGRIIQETGAKAVKIEGGKEIVPVIQAITQAGIPVVGHIGLTPQSVHQLGGFKVQGKTKEDALKIIEDAKALEAAGVFSIVLEAIPHDLAKLITETVSVPTIGIGAGNACDGQVLVFHDMIQYGLDRSPKFVKIYGQIGEMIKRSISQYKEEVKKRSFPAKEHTFSIQESVLEQLYGKV